MSNPFAEHAQNTADYLDMLKGDDNSGGATLTLKLNPDVTVDCTFDRIQDDFNLIAGGQSPKLLIDGCKFLAADIPAEKQAFVRRGLKCNLKPSPSSQVVQLEIFVGGLEQGGLIYRFMLRDTNYGA